MVCFQGRNKPRQDTPRGRQACTKYTVQLPGSGKRTVVAMQLPGSGQSTNAKEFCQAKGLIIFGRLRLWALQTDGNEENWWRLLVTFWSPFWSPFGLVTFRFGHRSTPEQSGPSTEEECSTVCTVATVLQIARFYRLIHCVRKTGSAGLQF